MNVRAENSTLTEPNKAPTISHRLLHVWTDNLQQQVDLILWFATLKLHYNQTTSLNRENNFSYKMTGLSLINKLKLQMSWY